MMMMMMITTTTTTTANQLCKAFVGRSAVDELIKKLSTF
jgi:hypothetical protein